jgi:hypothetical protein
MSNTSLEVVTFHDSEEEPISQEGYERKNTNDDTTSDGEGG